MLARLLTHLAGKYDRLGSIQNHTVFQMVAHGAGQHAAFNVPPLAHEIIRRVAMGDALHILLDNRAFIEIRGDVMRRGADEFDAALMRLVVWLGPFEAGQKGVVDIDATA